MIRPPRALRAAPLLLGLLALAGCPGPTDGPADRRSDIGEGELDHAMLSTVQLALVDGQFRQVGTCSGTHLGDGFILTNFHCVGHTDLYGPDNSGMGLAHGQTYHPQGWVVVLPTLDPAQPPVPTYVAQTVSADPALDVAVVRIVGGWNGQDPSHPAPLAGPVPIPAMSLADSDGVRPLDYVAVVGYPGLGGRTVTLTEGKIGGYDDQNGDGQNDSFKTTAAIAPGNSGGLAVDSDGRQIGIPTWQDVAGANKVDRLRMVNLARTVIEAALAGGTYTGPAPQSPQPQYPPQPPQYPQPQAPPQPPQYPPQQPQYPDPYATPPAAPDPYATPQDPGVLIFGTVVDGVTGQGIPGASVFVLRAGATYADLQAAMARGDEAAVNTLVIALATAGPDGAYQTTTPLPRGASYTIVVGGPGYQPRWFDGGLEITADDPVQTELNPLALAR